MKGRQKNGQEGWGKRSLGDEQKKGIARNGVPKKKSTVEARMTGKNPEGKSRFELRSADRKNLKVKYSLAHTKAERSLHWATTFKGWKKDS